MLNIKLIETDSLNEKNNYYLYEVETDNEHYYVSTSDEEIKDHNSEISLINNYTMLGREDFTDREWEIAKYLFSFLWDSSNGTNTCVDKDYYEEDEFTQDEMEKFVDKVNKLGNDGLEIYEDGGVEIYWAFFSMFDLKKCNPFEDYES